MRLQALSAGMQFHHRLKGDREDTKELSAKSEERKANS
jgi:hypothetical protein